MNAAIVLTPLLLVGLLLALVVPVVLKLMRKCPVRDITSEWLETFNIASYYPMEGLLNEEDFSFLSRQPGFDLSLHRKLRRERLRIFKQYLNRAIVDFNRLHTAIRIMLPQSTQDRSDLVGRLLWLRVRFSVSVVKAHLSYYLCLLGFGSLAVRSLINQLEEMNTALTLASASAAG